MKGSVIAVAVFLAALVSTPSAGADTLDTSPGGSAGTAWTIDGSTFAHDPTMIHVGSTYYLFYTGAGIQEKTSPDGHTWSAAVQVFPSPLPWWTTYAPSMTTNDVWAPDIHFFQGTYWMYYSVSSFGSNSSAIGLVSATSPSGPWTDNGLVLSSFAYRTYNAIDPDLCFDATGAPYLVFGSFWNDIYITKLDPSTMKPTGPLTNIAFRVLDPATGTLRANSHAAEGAGIILLDGSYYLFMSWDQCCQGSGSTYKIVYARSDSITGPYYDASGNPSSLSEGTRGGTILDQASGQWAGPGGEFVFQDTNGGWLMVHHAYDTNTGGTPTLRIKDLYFHDGWPTYTPYPTVSITSPRTGSTVTAGSMIMIAASASESVKGSTAGTMKSVAFYQGSTLLGTVTSAPYTYTWSGAAAGAWSLTAVATDSTGNATTSSPVSISVTAGR
jgi:arabinan endo-1,5-alpha-L-arabinosidase